MPELNFLCISILLLGGMCFYAAISHALMARARVEARLHAQFALTACLVGLLAVSMVFTYSPRDAEQWVATLRFQTVLVCVLWPLFAVTLGNYAGYHHRLWVWALWTSSLALIAHTVLVPPTNLYSSFEGIAWRHVAGMRYAYGVGQLGAGYFAYSMISLAALAYAVVAAVKQAARSDGERGQPLAQTLAVFTAILLVDGLIDARVIEAPSIGPFAFIVLMLLMSHRLGQDLRSALQKRTHDLEDANRELRESEEKLMRAQRMDAFGQLAGGVAHDFNNLLTAILGHSALLRARLKRGELDPAVASDALDEVDGAAKRAASLTRQLLMFSRKQLTQVEEIEADAVIVKLQAMLERLVSEDIEFSVVCQSPGAIVTMDLTHLEQIVMNLVVNASHAMTGGGVLRVSTRPVSGEAGEFVRITVSDTGSGMDAETQARAFEPFFTTKPLGHGTGLGLATVHAIVTKAGGRVSIESVVGRGTEVFVELPSTRGKTTTAKERDRSSPRHGRVGCGQHILVCEDEPAVRSFTREALEAGGYRVTVCEDPAAALEHFASEDPPDLLVTDVVMPKMNGPDLVARLAPTRPDFPVLFVSGYTAGVLARHGLREEQAEFLAKPFTAEQLLEHVARLLPAETHASPVREHPSVG